MLEIQTPPDCETEQVIRSNQGRTTFNLCDERDQSWSSAGFPIAVKAFGILMNQRASDNCKTFFVRVIG
jgi:hypothetical protein